MTSVFMLQGGIGNLLFQYSASRCASQRGDFRIRYSEFSQGAISRLGSYLDLEIPRASPLDHSLVGAVGAGLGSKVLFAIKCGRSLGLYSSQLVTDDALSEFGEAGPKRGRLFLGYFQDQRWHDQNSIDFVLERLRRVRSEAKFSLLPGVVGIHLRRGDYLSGKENLSLNWYLAAMQEFDPHRSMKVMVVGDDPLACLALEALLRLGGWTLENSSKVSPELTTSSAWRDFNLISGCEALVCSNSTFSWWAAKLSAALWHGKNQIAFPYTPRLSWIEPDWWTNSEVTGGGEVEERFRTALLSAVQPAVPKMPD